MAPTNAAQVDGIVRPLLLKDLRTQCRARGLNPGGNREVLAERLREHMLETGNVTIVSEGASLPTGTTCAPLTASPTPSAQEPREPLTERDAGYYKNNYVRPEGQNVGNFITDRPSSRVLAPPGGGTSIRLG